MLVLTQQVGNMILINDGEIKVKILGLEKGQIRVGIEAPKEIDIVRDNAVRKDRRVNFISS